MLSTKITQDHMSVSDVGFAVFCVSPVPAALPMLTSKFRPNAALPILKQNFTLMLPSQE
jgi:hypothetical protein